MSDDLDAWIAAERSRYTSGDFTYSKDDYHRALTLLQEHRAALRDILLYVGDHEICGRNEAPCPVLQARTALAGKP